MLGKGGGVVSRENEVVYFNGHPSVSSGEDHHEGVLQINWQSFHLVVYFDGHPSSVKNIKYFDGHPSVSSQEHQVEGVVQKKLQSLLCTSMDIRPSPPLKNII